jgi:hypothetical protein
MLNYFFPLRRVPFEAGQTAEGTPVSKMTQLRHRARLASGAGWVLSLTPRWLQCGSLWSVALHKACSRGNACGGASSSHFLAPPPLCGRLQRVLSSLTERPS